MMEGQIGGLLPFKWEKLYRRCILCPRSCKIDRTHFNKGYCRESYQLKVAYIGPHFGEEPPISGERGSGTVFLSGCSLKCSYCQNYQISHKGMGEYINLFEMRDRILKMIEEYRVHNLNFVTPDHFFPHIFSLIYSLRKEGVYIPIIFNLSGYQSVEILKIAEPFCDIYLPDFKYSDPSLSQALSMCKDYPKVALDAISEMIRQKGFLSLDSNCIAKRGVLVRHLILPGKIKNSIDALSMLFIEFGKELPLSLMSQYYPVIRNRDPDLNRILREEEFNTVYEHALSLGFEDLFVQLPEKYVPKQPPPFVPDFKRPYPFPLCKSKSSN